MISSICGTPKPLPIIGYTTRRHLLIDLDDTTERKARAVIKVIFEAYPEVGDCLFIMSSHNDENIRIRYNHQHHPYHKIKRPCFHLVFNNLIGYNKICTICELLAGLRIVNKAYSDIRNFRGDCTLRVSPKICSDEVKDTPEVIQYIRNARANKKGTYICRYLEFLRFTGELFRAPRFTPNIANHDTDNT